MKFTNFILLIMMSIVFASTSSAIDFKSISKEPKKEKKKIEKKFTKDDIFDIERANILKAGGGYFQSVGFNEIEAGMKIVEAFKNSYNCNVANTITSKSGWYENTYNLIFIFMREIKYHNADVSKGIELDSDDLKKTKKWLPYVKKQARCPESILKFLSEYDKLTLSLYKEKLVAERKVEQAKNEKIKKQKDEKIKNKAKHVNDLKTGVIPIKNIDDASIYYSAKSLVSG
ncbi:MAG: hypothetical protein SWH54_16905 [Thermodesulfobacteriota bacterium]|nr:hypothetical protein [Thermodesulfobacteriota bacterium]